MPTKKTVLMIDDDQDFTASVRAVLEAEGYDVEVASSGREGLRKVRESEPDVIVLDVMMESTSEGYAVSGAIMQSEDYATFRDIPVIMVSSIPESPDERFPRAPEVDQIRPRAYLTKPLDIPRFLEVVAKAARR